MSKALSRHGVNGSSSGKFSESEGRRGEKVVFIAKKTFFRRADFELEVVQRADDD